MTVRKQMCPLPGAQRWDTTWGPRSQLLPQGEPAAGAGPWEALPPAAPPTGPHRSCFTPGATSAPRSQRDRTCGLTGSEPGSQPRCLRGTELQHRLGGADSTPSCLRLPFNLPVGALCADGVCARERTCVTDITLSLGATSPNHSGKRGTQSAERLGPLPLACSLSRSSRGFTAESKARFREPTRRWKHRRRTRPQRKTRVSGVRSLPGQAPLLCQHVTTSCPRVSPHPVWQGDKPGWGPTSSPTRGSPLPLRQVLGGPHSRAAESQRLARH